MSEGTKHDQNKNRVELLSPFWLFGVGNVLTFGARKYAAHNWRKGLDLSRCLGATLRHVFAFLGGEDLDPETGLSHLFHASCELMFASELYAYRPDLDDRWKTPKKMTEEERLVATNPLKWKQELDKLCPSSATGASSFAPPAHPMDSAPDVLKEKTRDIYWIRGQWIINEHGAHIFVPLASKSDTQFLIDKMGRFEFRKDP